MSPSPKRGISIFPSFDGNMPEERLSRSSLTKDTFQAFVFIVQNFYRNQYQWEYNSPITYEKKEWRMILQVSHYLLSRTKNSIIALYAAFFIVSGVILQETTEDNVVLKDLEKISRHAEYQVQGGLSLQFWVKFTGNRISPQRSNSQQRRPASRRTQRADLRFRHTDMFRYRQKSRYPPSTKERGTD